MVNRSAFEQMSVAPGEAPLVMIVPAGAEQVPLADAAIRALSRLTGAAVVCRLSAVPGAAVEVDRRLELGWSHGGRAGGGWVLEGDEAHGSGALSGHLAADGLAVAVAAAGLFGLTAPRFGGPSVEALTAEAAGPGRDALTAALPGVWTGHAALLPLVEGLPHGTARGAAAALEARRRVLAFRASGEGSRSDLAAGVAAMLERAREEALGDPLTAWAAGTVDAMFTRHYADAAAAFRVALADDASNATVLLNAAMGFAYAWDFDLALWAVRRAARVSPADGLTAQRGFAGALAAFHGQRFDEAVAFADAALAAKPDFTNVLRLKAAALVHLGRGEAARAAMAAALAADPTETVSRNAAVNPLREFPGFHRFLDGLAEAGMPA
jgi:hypothetical protein